MNEQNYNINEILQAVDQIYKKPSERYLYNIHMGKHLDMFIMSRIHLLEWDLSEKDL